MLELLDRLRQHQGTAILTVTHNTMVAGPRRPPADHARRGAQRCRLTSPDQQAREQRDAPSPMSTPPVPAVVAHELTREHTDGARRMRSLDHVSLTVPQVRSSP